MGLARVLLAAAFLLGAFLDPSHGLPIGFTKIAETGTPVPGGAGTFVSFTNVDFAEIGPLQYAPSLRSRNEAYRAQVSEPGESGIYSWIGGQTALRIPEPEPGLANTAISLFSFDGQDVAATTVEELRSQRGGLVFAHGAYARAVGVERVLGQSLRPERERPHPQPSAGRLRLGFAAGGG